MNDNKNTTGAAIGFVILGAAFAVASLACTVADTPGDSKGREDTKDASATSTGASSGAPASSSSSGSAAVNDAAPPTTDPLIACVQDCAKDNPEGEAQFSEILLPCTCAADVCADVCTACGVATTQQELFNGATDACRTCVIGSLQNGKTCNTALRKSCPKQASCPGYALCAQACQSKS